MFHVPVGHLNVLGKISIQFFYFLTGLFVSFDVECMRCLHTFDINPC